MQNKNVTESNIDNLIALCHILDNYSEFTKNLIGLITTKYNRDDVYNLDRITHRKFVIGARKVKRFYQENKDVIDTINKYSNISNFINFNYDSKGNLSEDSSLNFFYQYFLCNKDELEQIESVLIKLKKLGFDKFEFDEGKDFTQDEYGIDTSFNSNFDITYLDNIKVVPNYQNNIVKYRTTGSNYSIVTRVSFGKLCNYGKTIILNSLVFDVNSLPENITKENIFDRLISLKEEQKEDCTSIRNSVDLSISVVDFQSQYDSTNRTIERLYNISCKDELREILLKIRENLDKLQNIITEYDDSVSGKDSSITKEILEQEKQMYLKRRYWENIDID